MKNINPILIIIAGILISFTIVYKDRQNSFKIKSNNFDNLKKANFIKSVCWIFCFINNQKGFIYKV